MFSCFHGMIVLMACQALSVLHLMVLHGGTATEKNGGTADRPCHAHAERERERHRHSYSHSLADVPRSFLTQALASKVKLFGVVVAVSSVAVVTPFFSSAEPSFSFVLFFFIIISLQLKTQRSTARLVVCSILCSFCGLVSTCPSLSLRTRSVFPVSPPVVFI